MKSNLSTRIIASVVLSLAAIVPLATLADPVVTNVRGEQRSGTELVDVFYDLDAANPPSVSVRLQVSADGGSNWTVPVVSVSQSVGNSVSPGKGKHILWNAGADWNGQVSKNVRFRVTASDAPSLQSGLVAYYPFDGNANDASGNGNNGIVFDAISVPDRFSRMNGAYSFSGGNSIQLPVNINSSALPELTISVWVNPEQQGTSHRDRHMIWTHDNLGYDRSLQIESGDWSVFAGGPINWATGVRADINTWQNIVVVYSSTDVAIYRNGQQYLRGSAAEPSDGENIITVGRYPSDDYSEGFLGAIDDVRIYNRALSASEVEQIYKLDGFALIPAGSFQMGDGLGEGNADELPVHTVQVSAFYMAQYEVTKALWDGVRTWGASHGYTDLVAGAGNALDHPVNSISWYNMVKWCNAKSEKEGLRPCYTVAGQVYMTNDSSPNCDFQANGYRLPTEAEWEKAARGGLTRTRFPWGGTISHSDANFTNNGGESYQSGSAGPDPIWSNYNGGSYPYTSPVGVFLANGYGLYDMVGNVWERCWDLYGSYPSIPQTDPHGATSGSTRVIRGCGWCNNAYYCRSAARSSDRTPGYLDNNVGFRLARSSSNERTETQ